MAAYTSNIKTVLAIIISVARTIFLKLSISVYPRRLSALSRFCMGRSSGDLSVNYFIIFFEVFVEPSYIYSTTMLSPVNGVAEEMPWAL